jgi:hypothetical protein
MKYKLTPSRFITIFEDGEMHFHNGRIPDEIVGAADRGLYEIIDITDPDCPLRYCEEGWANIDPLPRNLQGG